jgi:hypothetical protein
MAKNKLQVARRQAANVDTIINGGISRANAVVSTHLADGAPVEFERASLNEVDFYATDPVTGMSFYGSYTLNDSGIVTEYGFSIYGSPTDYESVLFAYIELDGGASSFLSHAQAFDDNPNSQVFFTAFQTGAAQPVANFLDSLPGANHYDPYSTGVSVFEGPIALA